MAKLFICYRREDTAPWAGRLHDWLRAHFSEVFMDIDVEPGDDWADMIEAQVGKCDALIALIGPKWSTATDEHGRRRIDNEDDWVRREIEVALARRIRVIPVVVEGAEPPAKHELPDSLAALTRKQALRVWHNSFHADVTRLLKPLGVSGPEQRARQPGDVMQMIDGPVRIELTPAEQEFTFRAAPHCGGIGVFVSQTFDSTCGYTASLSVVNIHRVKNGRTCTTNEFHKDAKFIGPFRLEPVGGGAELHYGQERGWWLIAGPPAQSRILHIWGDRSQYHEKYPHPHGEFVATVKVEAAEKTTERTVHYSISDEHITLLGIGP